MIINRQVKTNDLVQKVLNGAIHWICQNISDNSHHSFLSFSFIEIKKENIIWKQLLFTKFVFSIFSFHNLIIEIIHEIIY